MSADDVIRSGSRVELHFRLALENGFVVDDTHDDGPFFFIFGDGSIVAGLEQALAGNFALDQMTISLSANQAFGVSDPLNVMSMARSEFSGLTKFTEGVIVGFTTPSGEEVLGTVLEVGTEAVLVDFNHPLSDQTVVFEVDIVSVDNSGIN